MIERHATIHGALHPLRATDLTASDFAAAIGDSPFKTPLELYAEKTGHLQPKGETAVMKRGRLLEQVAITMAREEHPDWDIRYPLNLYLRDPELRLGATPDAQRVNADGSVTNMQIKVINRRIFEDEWVPSGPPLHYVLQTGIEGMLMDAEGSMIIALVVDYAALELFYFDVPRHPDAEAQFKEHAKAFWDNVITGNRPAADLKRDAATLVALFPKSVKDPVLDLSQENQLPGMLDKRIVLKEEIKHREAEVDEIETYIKDKLGPAERATLPGWKITWPTKHRRSYTVAAKDYRRLYISKTDEDIEQDNERQEATP